MTTHSGVTFMVKKGCDVPKDYLFRVASNNPSCAGAATVVDGSVLMQIFNTPCPVEGYEDIRKELKEQDVFFWSGNHPGDVGAEDIQPFVLNTDEKDNPIIVLFIEGNFHGTPPEGSNHSPAWHLMQEDIAPKIAQLARLVDGDLDKLLGEMQSPLFKKDMDRLSIDHGNITFLIANGDKAEHLVFGNNPTVGFSWGWTSQAYGYETPKAEDRPAQGVKPAASKFSIKSKAVPATPPVDLATAGTPLNKPTSVPGVKPTDTTIKAPEEEFFLVKADMIWDKKRKEHFYRTAGGGIMPKTSYHNCPTIKVTKKFLEELNAKGDLKHLPTLRALIGATTEPDISAPAEPDKGVEPVKPQDDTKKVGEPRPVIVPAEEKRQIKDFINDPIFKATVDKHREIIGDPAKLKEYNSKIITFCEATGVDGIEKTFGWPPEILEEMFKTWPAASALLYCDLVRAYSNALNELAKKTEPKKEEVAATPTAASIKGLGQKFKIRA